MSNSQPQQPGAGNAGSSQSSNAPNLMDFFGRVVVVNLARRPERLVQFQSRLKDWPFKTPQRFEAVDGTKVELPAHWQRGAGAWGCLQSHLAIVQQAIADKVSSLLVLEDDAYPVPDFSQRVASFFRQIPEDWDCLMLGAEHLLPPIPVSMEVGRCTSSIRTHAYAVRGTFMEMLSVFWQKTRNDHCDLVLSSLMKHYKAYTPVPPLFGQDGGYSDVTERGEKLRFVTDEQREAIGARDPNHLIERLIVRVKKPIASTGWQAAVASMRINR